MAGNKAPKQKLLQLMKIFYEESDQNHGLTIQDLIKLLNARGIEAERKGLYKDFEELRQFGIEIESVKSKQTTYYVEDREFDLTELKMLVDVVEASRFITSKKSRDLIKKLQGLTSKHNASELERSIKLETQNKNTNESIFYNIDRVHEALRHNSGLTFRYYRYDLNKDNDYYHGEEFLYQAFPLSLIWHNENYYLVCYDLVEDKKKHFRLDRMDRVSVDNQLTLPNDEVAQNEEIDRNNYTRRNFNMFDGEEVRIQIKFNKKVLGVVLDQFGHDLKIYKLDEESFEIKEIIALSPQFYAWIFGLGKDAYIVSPEKVRAEFQQQLQTVQRFYQD